MTTVSADVAWTLAITKLGTSCKGYFIFPFARCHYRCHVDSINRLTSLLSQCNCIKNTGGLQELRLSGFPVYFRFAFYFRYFLFAFCFFICVFFFLFAFSIIFYLHFLFFICVFFFFICVFFFYLRFLFFYLRFLFCLRLSLLGHRIDQIIVILNQKNRAPFSSTYRQKAHGYRRPSRDDFVQNYF